MATFQEVERNAMSRISSGEIDREFCENRQFIKNM